MSCGPSAGFTKISWYILKATCVALQLLFMGISLGASAWLMKWLVSALDPEKDQKKRVRDPILHLTVAFILLRICK